MDPEVSMWSVVDPAWPMGGAAISAEKCGAVGRRGAGSKRAHPARMPGKRSLQTLSTFAPMALLATLVACSPPNYGNEGGVGGNGGSSGAGAPDVTSTSTGDLGFHPSGSGGAGGDGVQGCAATSQEATSIPVNMFVMVDKSGSMKDNSKWTNARDAFTSFFQDPAAASLRVAMRFFPDTGCDGTACDVNVCSQPAVDVGALSDAAHAQALVDAFAAHSPGGGTPMSAALGGAEKWAQDYNTKVMGTEKVVVVLVTDGEPNGCDDNVDHIAKEAADAFTGAGVMTFAVGLAGSNQGTMDKIATGGHTTQGFFIGNGNAKADLLAALKAIQQSSLGCAYAMPAADPGQTIDPTRVNVSFTPSGGAAETLGQVPGAASCSGAGGWYYDDPAKPATITLCPATCTTVQADPGAKMQIVLGCTTHPA
jgi:hypothetical protein